MNPILFRYLCCTGLLMAALGLFAPSNFAQTYEASSAQRDDLGARMAFDGKPTTRWSARFKEKSGWIQVTFDEPREFSSVTIYSGTTDLKGAPKGFQILAGKPGSLKTLKKIKTNDRDSRLVKFRKTKARCWRLKIDTLINEKWSPTIAELTWSGPNSAGTKDKTESTAGAPIKASDPGIAGRGPERVLDGDPKTNFEAAKKGKVWLERRFDRPQTFDALELNVHARAGFGVAKNIRLKARVGRRWKKLLSLDDVYRNHVRLCFKSTKAEVWRLEIEEVVNDRGSVRLSQFDLSQLGENEFPAEAAPEVDPEDVNQAIERGAAWLTSKRRKDGNWPTKHSKEYPMGVMSLCGLALKKSGLTRDDPLMLDLAARLKKMESQKVYSVALQVLFLRALSAKRYNDRVEKLADWLIEAQGPDGLWAYPTGRTDLSNAQYALLALKAAKELGIKIPNRVFKKSLDWMLRGPQKGGGFNYVPHGKAARDPATGSMTAAGLACIDICLKALGPNRGREQSAKKVVSAAFDWLDERFVVEMNPGSHQSHYYYYLYGIERIGAFYLRKMIGGKPWYPLGAEHLLAWQRSEGSWHGSIEDTCFALLFLNRSSLTK